LSFVLLAEPILDHGQSGKRNKPRKSFDSLRKNRAAEVDNRVNPTGCRVGLVPRIASKSPPGRIT
jgi:hypothetical protein